MFEKEIQFITDFNLNKIKKAGTTFTFNKLFDADIHPALLKYISGRIDYLIYQDKKILLENSDFDYSGIKISEYFNLIANEIRNTKKLTQDEVKKYIENGVLFNANFIIQPKTALTHLIFRYSEETKSTAEIKVFLNYIYYYDYIRDIINSYISKKNPVNINRNEFKTLLDKIDSELITNNTKSIISDALVSISDFYNEGGLSKSSIQPALIEAFLIEKNLDELRERLSSEIKDTKKKMDIGEIKNILLSKKISPPETPVESITKNSDDKIIEEEKPFIPADTELLEDFEVEKAESSIQPEEIKRTETEINPEEEKRNDDLENYIENQVKDEELLIEFEPSNYADSILEEEILEENIEEPERGIDIEEIIEEDIPVSKENKTEKKNSYTEERRKTKDIFSFLSKKEIDKIISIIFNDDGDDFANTMEKISECRNYEQASEILKSVFVTYHTNPYAREAVTLTNAVSNYFHQD